LDDKDSILARDGFARGLRSLWAGINRRRYDCAGAHLGGDKPHARQAKELILMISECYN